ncbi:hypothetical protein EZS27_008633 [termite gut metagenome]|uniref:Uncharacterized protein n=1 Tax=termite gut metagenome TaxID=433724 RepID=A0A5J4SC13_9ZZZZ
MLSPYLFIDNLMKSLDKPYYVSLSSAAALYGAVHQQPMRYTVLRKALPRSVGKLR